MESLFAARARRIYGVDFSGAAKAGKKIWIATGVIDGNALRVEDCQRAAEKLHTVKDLAPCPGALCRFIGTEREAAFGLDLPFGLPRALVNEDTWQDFVRSFSERYPTPQQFYQITHKAADELRRYTDKQSKTPFAPNHLRLYRQTYHGIRDVLSPLVRGHLACVVPVQEPLPGRPWILEVCPASTLKLRHQEIRKPYKGNQGSSTAREHILQAVQDAGSVFIPKSLKPAILDDGRRRFGRRNSRVCDVQSPSQLRWIDSMWGRRLCAGGLRLRLTIALHVHI